MRRADSMPMKPSSIRAALAVGALLGVAGSGSWVHAEERYQPLPVESRQAGDAQYQPVPSPEQSVRQPAVPANVQWELYSQLQQMQQEIQRLRGMVEEQAYQIEQINRQQRDRYIDLDQRISKLTGSGGQSTATTRPSDTAVSAQPANEKATYDQAIALMRERQFDTSIELLEKQLTTFPRGDYAANARYWLGELYMALTPPQLDTAKSHFVRLLSQFPQHAKVPDALFKLGSLYQQEGEPERAKVTLQKLVSEHPNHASARLARDALSRLP